MGDLGVVGADVVDVTLSYRRVRLWPMNLACCAVEADEAIRLLVEAEPAVAAEPPAEGPPVLDVLLVAGTVTAAFLPEIRAVWQAMPQPRHAIAFGACTISGGPYWDSYSVVPGLVGELDPMVAVAGCPPRPEALRAAVELALAGLEP